MVRLAQEREVLQCFDGNHTPVLSSVSVFQLKHSGKGLSEWLFFGSCRPLAPLRWKRPVSLEVLDLLSTHRMKLLHFNICCVLAANSVHVTVYLSPGFVGNSSVLLLTRMLHEKSSCSWDIALFSNVKHVEHWMFFLLWSCASKSVGCRNPFVLQRTFITFISGFLRSRRSWGGWWLKNDLRLALMGHTPGVIMCGLYTACSV